MARKTTIMNQLEQSLTDMNLNPADIITRTRRLLSAYTKLHWITQLATPTTTDLPQLRAALDLIDTPTITPQPQTQQLAPLICDIMQQTLQQIRNYPTEGEQYHHILYNAYFATDPQPDTILMDQLHLERTTYYSRKREAVTLFGYLIYTKYLPQLHQATR